MPRDIPRKPPPTKDEREFALVVYFAQGIKAALMDGESLDDIGLDVFCPLCGTGVSASRAASNGHLILRCGTHECVRMVE